VRVGGGREGGKVEWVDKQRSKGVTGAEKEEERAGQSVGVVSGENEKCGRGDHVGAFFCKQEKPEIVKKDRIVPREKGKTKRGKKTRGFCSCRKCQKGEGHPGDGFIVRRNTKENGEKKRRAPKKKVGEKQHNEGKEENQMMTGKGTPFFLRHF